MAEFNGVNLTKAGRILLAKAITGKKLNFSRVSCGDGILDEEQNTYEFTSLINELYELQIVSCELGYNSNGTISPGVAELRATLNNKDIENGFYIREVGVFAEDPDTGEEVLYGYCNSGEKCDYMPEHGGSDVVEFLYKFQIVIDQAQNVTAICSSGIVYVSQVEFLNMFDEPAPVSEFWTRTEGDNRKFRPLGVPQARVAIMGIQNLGSIQEQIDEVSEATIQNSMMLFDDIQKVQGDIQKVKEEAIKDHEDLEGLQGGAKNDHKHLTQQELKKLQNFNHEEMSGLLGGSEAGHYHVTQAALNKLQKFEHNALNNIQGGTEDERYHLSLEQYNRVDKFNHDELNGVRGGDDNGKTYHITSAQHARLSKCNFEHENLWGLLGGSKDEHYHITSDQHTRLRRCDFEHERLYGLLGGSGNEHYHLTEDELKKLQNLSIQNKLSDSTTQPPSVSLLQNHVQSFDPHPNWKIPLNNIIGINSLISGANKIDGYVKFSNGLIIQWGVCKLEKPTDHKGVKHNFNIKFPNMCGIVIACLGSRDDAGYCTVHDYNLSYFYLKVMAPYLKGVKWINEGYANWLAIGY